jgi:hypothetical protein
LKKLNIFKFKKWTNIAVLLLFLTLAYKLYELDIHVWACDVEENTGSCLLASRMYLDSGNHSMAEKYLRSSCDGEYPLGCFDLGNHLIKKGDREEGKKRLVQSCELGHKPACP